MKYLKSSLREKKRYIYFELSKKSDCDNFEKAFSKEFKALAGEKGFAEANPLLIQNLWKGTSGVLRVNHKNVPETKVALTLIRKIKGKEILIKTGKIYGSLKKLKSEVE